MPALVDTTIRLLSQEPLAGRMTPLAMALRGRFLVGSRPVGADFARRFVASAAESGIDVFRLHDPLNDVSNLREAGEAITNAEREFDAGLVYGSGHTGETEALVEQAKKLPELGAARILLHDPSSSLEPHRAHELVGALREASGLPVGLYCQGAGGNALAAALEAVRAGADLISCALYPIALTLHRVSGEALATSLAGLGQDAGVDGDRLDEVLEELLRVREEVGWPPLAAPIGQILGSQALLNVLSGTRYQTTVDELRSLVASGVDQARAERIREVVRIVQESGVGEITIDEAGMRVSVRRTPDPIEPVLASATGESAAAEAEEAFTAEEPSGDGIVRVEAPMVGTFYRAPQPGAPPFVEEGDAVGPGQTLCILEAMKLMNEVNADTEAVVRAIHVGNAEPVEFGQLLFELEPINGRPLGL